MAGPDLSGVIAFRLCGQGFGLPVDRVREVVPIAWLDRPPQLPSLVRGILNLGGQAVPVLRLDRLLGLGDGSFGLDASILVMRPGEGASAPLGLLVEHVDSVRPADEFSPMGLVPEHSFNGCLVDSLGRDGQVVHLLSWERLLLEQERDRLNEFQALLQLRLADITDSGP